MAAGSSYISGTLDPATPKVMRIAILGTGLIGSSIGLALRRVGFAGSIFGWDKEPAALARARLMGAVDPAPASADQDEPFLYAMASQIIVLAGPVFSIADWLEQLAPVLSPNQLVTDVGSVKGYLLARAGDLYNLPGRPAYLPGHPMAGKEYSGAQHAEAALFEGAAWLLTPPAAVEPHPLEGEWRSWVGRMGARITDLPPEKHDLLCAWVSHLPQMVSTALSALFEESFRRRFADDPELGGIGGRALREMTRLGASPFSMWRDIAHTNAPAIEAALLALEQELTHIRENLRTAELRTAFEQANAFRASLTPRP
jgi:prephenate dehydrogenase